MRLGMGGASFQHHILCIGTFTHRLHILYTHTNTLPTLIQPTHVGRCRSRWVGVVRGSYEVGKIV